MTEFKKELLAKSLANIIYEIGKYFLRSWLIMLVWNAVAPMLFYVSPLTFWQAIGLNLLTGWLFRYRNPHERED